MTTSNFIARLVTEIPLHESLHRPLLQCRITCSSQPDLLKRREQQRFDLIGLGFSFPLCHERRSSHQDIVVRAVIWPLRTQSVLQVVDKATPVVRSITITRVLVHDLVFNPAFPVRAAGTDEYVLCVRGDGVG